MLAKMPRSPSRARIASRRAPLLKRPAFLLVTLLLGSWASSSLAAADGLSLDRGATGDVLRGTYSIDGHVYSFVSREENSRLVTQIDSPDGSILARVNQSEDRSYRIEVGGIEIDPDRQLEPAARDALTQVLNQHGYVLRRLPLELSCADSAPATRRARYGLQLPLIALAPDWLTIEEQDLDAIRERCRLTCDEMVGEAEFGIRCGVGIFPVSEVFSQSLPPIPSPAEPVLWSDPNPSSSPSQGWPPGGIVSPKAHDDCYLACGAGCAGCGTNAWCDKDHHFWVEYRCYTRSCCTSHDACVEAAGGLFNLAAFVCHTFALLNTCGPLDSTGDSRWLHGTYDMPPFYHDFGVSSACTTPPTPPIDGCRIEEKMARNCCPNESCEEGADESCSSCPEDCGSCPGSFCGDGTCDRREGEDCINCDLDCECITTCRESDCFNAACPAQAQSCASCSGSCPAGCTCHPWCGDGACNGTETCREPWNNTQVFDCEKDCGFCAGAYCGDGIQQLNEDCSSCPEDWGCAEGNVSTCCRPFIILSTDSGDSRPAATCGDAQCNGEENCVTCSVDCGVCAPICGDSICSYDIGEDCTNCARDCWCAATCGDGACTDGEKSTTCASDCLARTSVCGDGLCTGDEICGRASATGTGLAARQCIADCGTCPAYCGDADCRGGETWSWCPEDCSDVDRPAGCGDGECSATERCHGCSIDCGACSSGCGNGICEGSESCQSCGLDCCTPICGDGHIEFGEQCEAGVCCHEVTCMFRRSGDTCLNYALTGWATQSSTWKENEASNAADGLVEGSSFAMTHQGEGQWWQLDLGGPKKASEIRAWNLRHPHARYMRDFRILVDPDDCQFDFDHWTYTFRDQALGNPSRFQFVTRDVACVRLVLDADEHLRLGELEVVGVDPEQHVAPSPLCEEDACVPGCEAVDDCSGVACGNRNGCGTICGSASDAGCEYNYALATNGGGASSLTTWSSQIANHAIDGDTLDFDRIAMTHQGTYQWWQVDLGSPQRIQRVRAWKMNHWHGDYFNDFVIEADPDDCAFDGDQWRIATFSNRPLERPSTFEFAPTFLRCVRVTVLTEEHLRLQELEVIGLAPGSPWCGNGIVDGAERCDGGACCSADCTLAPAGGLCRAASGPCDQEESCNGSSAGCPGDELLPDGAVCRPAVDACDREESCNGFLAECPADEALRRGTVCRPAAGGCDVAELCDGVSIACAADEFVDDSTPCDDGNTCTAGVCGPAPMMVFMDPVDATPEGWTCQSCSPVDPFYQRFPVGGGSFGIAGGAETHDHTLTLSISGPNAGTVGVVAKDSYSPIRAATNDPHTHPGTSGRTAPATHVPPYRNLKVISANSNTETLPYGAIVLLDSELLPSSGLAPYLAQNGYFIRGDGVTRSGGAASHSHAFSLMSARYAGGWDSAAQWDVHAAPLHHDHSFSATTALLPNEPQHVQAVLARVTDPGGILAPVGTIALFRATPSSAWRVLSAPGGELHGAFLKASAHPSFIAQGANEHHPPPLTVRSAPPTSGEPLRGPNTAIRASSTHTHEATVTFDAQDHRPPYRTVILARKE